MSEMMTLTIDGVEIKGRPGQTILEAAEEAGIYIPRLCYLKGLVPFGSCRVCTVLVNGRPQAACTQPVAEGMIVENNTEKVRKTRCQIIEMLFVEGNHYCPTCETSGNCELQAMGYRLALLAPQLPYFNMRRELDASHKDVYVDRNRCILCGRCVRASRHVDGKNVFGFEGRGIHKRIAVDAEHSLSETALAATDAAAKKCPTGSIVIKRTGWQVPVGRRTYDHVPIGSDIERKETGATV